MGAPTPEFKNLKRKTTVIEKETKRKKEQEEYRFWSYDGRGNQEGGLFPPIYLSLFLP